MSRRIISRYGVNPVTRTSTIHRMFEYMHIDHLSDDFITVLYNPEQMLAVTSFQLEMAEIQKIKHKGKRHRRQQELKQKIIDFLGLE